MPSGTLALTFAADEAKMRWREPYVTEGLNRKVNRIVPRGIYAGFTLDTHALNRTVEVQADTANEHLAVYNTSTGYSLTIRRTGDFTLDLTAFAGLTVYLAVFASYAIANTTVCEIRVYTVAQYNAAVEKDEILVLGVVNVPAGAVPIPVADISAKERDLPFDNVLPGGQIWFPLVQNGSFEMNPAEVIHPTAPASTIVVPDPDEDQVFSRYLPNWTFVALLSLNQATARVSDADNSADGGAKCLALEIAVAGASTLTSFATAPDLFLVQATSEREFRVKFAYKSPYAPTAGSVTVWATFVDDEVTGATPLGVLLGTLDLSVSVLWKTFDLAFTAPVGYRMLTGVWLYSGSLVNPAVPVPANLQYTTVGVNQTVFQVDDFQVHALFSTRKPDEAATLRRKTEIVSTLVFEGRGVDAEDTAPRIVANREVEEFDWFAVSRLGLAVRADAGDLATGANVAYLRSTSFIGFCETGVVPRFIGGGAGAPLDRIPILSGSSGPAAELPQFVVYTGDNTLRGVTTTVGAYFNAAGIWAPGTVVGTIGGAQDSAFRLDVGGISLPDTADPGQGFQILRRANPAAGTWVEGGWTKAIVLPIKADDSTFSALDMLGSMPCGLTLGSGIVGGSNDEQVPRLSLAASGSADTWTLAQRVVGGTGATNMWRLYAKLTGYALVSGAYWTQAPAQWNADDPGVLNAVRTTYNGADGTFRVEAINTTTVNGGLGIWTEGEWVNGANTSKGYFMVDLATDLRSHVAISNSQTDNTNDGSVLDVLGIGRNTYVKVQSSNTLVSTQAAVAFSPDATDLFTDAVVQAPNSLFKSNIAKAFISVNFIAAGATVTVVQSFGIQVLRRVDVFTVRFTFKSAFAVVPIITFGCRTLGYFPCATTVTTTYVDVQVYDVLGASVLSLPSINHGFDMVVLGDLA